MYHMYLNKTKIEEHIYFSVNRRHRVVVFFKKVHTFLGGGKEPKNGNSFSSIIRLLENLSNIRRK